MLFQIYGEGAIYQLLGCVLVFAGLVICNELARRSKFGGLLFFIIIPIALTIYFVAIQIGAAQGASWALNNTTYRYMNGWFHYAKLYAATAGCIGFMMLKYKWSIGKTESLPLIFLSLFVVILNQQSKVELMAAGGSLTRVYGFTVAGGTGLTVSQA